MPICVIKIWIAVHPDEPSNKDVQFIEPSEKGTFIDSERIDGNGEYVEYVEYVCLPIGTLG